IREMDRLHDLYDAIVEVRRELGMEPVPFHRFVELVRNQVNTMKAQGSREVAFRVAVKNGRGNFTARGLKIAADGGGVPTGGEGSRAPGGVPGCAGATTLS